MKKTFLSLFLILSLQNDVVAENILVSCGMSEGKTYFIDRNNNRNWRDNGITNGSIKLIFYNNNAADIIIRDKEDTFLAKSDSAIASTAQKTMRAECE